MKLPGILTALAGAALLSLVFANTYLPFRGSFETRGMYTFEVEMSSSAGGTAQLFFDAGRGFTEADSSRAPVLAGESATVAFAIQTSSVRGLRFDPINTEATIRVGGTLIRRPDGSVLKRFSPQDFSAANQIAQLNINDEVLSIRTVSGANDPFLYVGLGAERVFLESSWFRSVTPMIARAIPVFASIVALVAAWFFVPIRAKDILRSRIDGITAWGRRRPKSAVAATAAIAAIVSCYPVVFCGASLVSPNYGSALLYDGFPTLPASKSAEQTDVNGADIGAIMWQQVPLSMAQSDALLRDFELPLWNRYNSAGTVLLGQGQTMFGDPLHFGVILARGAAWAWDAKYIVAKWLMGLALGLTVLHVTRHPPASLIVAAASVFVGFFVFRANHPAFFSFCYGPWVLYAWCRIAGAAGRRGFYLSACGLLLACWALLTSGTAKEAYVSLFTMNFAGAMVVICSDLPWRQRFLRLGIAAAAGVVLMLLSAPIWVTFLDSMKASYSSYNAAFAFQLQPGLAIGFFDEVLFRPYWEDENVFNPSSNFLLLLGLLALLANLKSAISNRYALGAAIGALFPLVLAFGLVPPRWIVKFPFLGNIHHVDNSFGIGLIHLVAVLAGVGFAIAAKRLATKEGRLDLIVGGLLLFALVFHYIAMSQTVQRSTYTALLWGQSIPRSAFVSGSLAVLLTASAILAWTVHRALFMRRLGLGAGLTIAACVMALLWRHGMHLRTQFPGHTLNAAPRVDFGAESPGLQALRTDANGPARAVGLGSNLFPGWNGAHRIEGINGPDALMNPHVRELQTAFEIERIWDWRLLLFADSLPHARPFLNLFNVRYVVDRHSDQGKLGAILSPVRMADVDVYRNDEAWPRAFFADRLTAYDSPADFTRMVRSDSGRPIAAVQSGDRDAPALASRHAGTGIIVPAANYRLTTNSTRFVVDAPSAGFAVLLEPWLEDEFVAEIDGRPATYFRVNHAFKAVQIDTPGTHEIEFTYRPRRFGLSLGMGIAGLGVLGAGGFLAFRRSKDGQGSS